MQCLQCGRGALPMGMLVVTAATALSCYYGLSSLVPAPVYLVIFDRGTTKRPAAEHTISPTFGDSTRTPPLSPPSTSPAVPFLPCDWEPEKIPKPTRHQAFLRCNKTSAGIFLKEVPFSTTPAVTTLNSSDDASCLKRVIATPRCTDAGLRVPRVAHYVWFGEQEEMPLYFFVSVLSVVRFLRPCLVVFHGDRLPTGPHWGALLQLVPCIVYAPRSQPSSIFGNDIDVVEHSADVTRLRVLIEYGGVYVDTDQLVLRPVDDLLNQSVVLGLEETGEKCGNGFIFSQPQAKFLRLWLSRYVTFDDNKWGDHSTYLPYNMSREWPHLVTVVNSFFTPNWKHIEPLYLNTSYDWTSLYGLHLYYRFFYYFFDEGEQMDQMDCVIGDMARHILFGSRDACRWWEEK